MGIGGGPQEFGSLSHEWMLRFVEHRVGDQRVIQSDQALAEGRCSHNFLSMEFRELVIPDSGLSIVVLRAKRICR